MHPVSTKKGEFVYQKDYNADGFYIIMQGQCCIMNELTQDQVGSFVEIFSSEVYLCLKLADLRTLPFALEPPLPSLV